MRDSVELEWEGIPAVAVVHEAMRGSAQAIAQVSGMADQPFLTVGYPHVPLAIWTAGEIAEVTRELAPKVIALLTGAPEPSVDAMPTTRGFDAALTEIQGLARADGGDLVVTRHADGVVDLRLVVETAHCVECIMPRPFLERVALSVFERAGAAVTEVRIDDPRESPDFVSPPV